MWLTQNGGTASAAEMTGKRYNLVVRTLVEAFADRLMAVVLFGSQARGEARPGSDHDLLVVIENLPADPFGPPTLSARHSVADP